MKITKLEAFYLKQNLDSFTQKQVPFSFAIVKNVKILEPIVTEFSAKQQDLINEYALHDENGKFIPIEGKENPNTISDIKIENREEMMEKIAELEKEEVESEFVKIDMKKVYFDSKLGEKRTVADFIEETLEPALIMYLSKFEIIEL